MKSIFFFNQSAFLHNMYSYLSRQPRRDRGHVPGFRQDRDSEGIHSVLVLGKPNGRRRLFLYLLRRDERSQKRISVTLYYNRKKKKKEKRVQKTRTTYTPLSQNHPTTQHIVFILILNTNT